MILLRPMAFPAVKGLLGAYGVTRQMRSMRSAFLTTDRPVAVWRRDPSSLAYMGTGIASADEVRFALGPHDLLVLRPSFPEQRTVVDAARVLAVNRQLASHCYDMVI